MKSKEQLLNEYIKVLNQIMYGLEKLDNSRKAYAELNNFKKKGDSKND